MLTPSKVGFCIALTIAVSSALLHAEGATGPLDAGHAALESSDYDTAEKHFKAASQAGSARPSEAPRSSAFRFSSPPGAMRAAKSAAAGEAEKRPARGCGGARRGAIAARQTRRSGVDPGGVKGAGRATRAFCSASCTSPRDGARARKTR
jgi:hypothetical protein